MKLKQFRIDYKLGQSILAEMFGCKQANISNIENGVRNLTQAQLGILIDHYGIECIKPYLEATDMLPAQTVVNVDMNKTEIKGNTAPVQNGDNNQMSADATLVQVLKQQSDQNSALLAELSKRSEQMDRLITLLEKK